MNEWMDGDVDNSGPALNAAQICRLMQMTKVIREGVDVLLSLYEIKRLLGESDIGGAMQVWGDLEESEQVALWVAPTFGGIFTTTERELIKGGTQ